MISTLINMVAVSYGLDRRETHMMMGMLLGKMNAQGVLNTIDRFGPEMGREWLNSVLATVSEAVELETPHQLQITTKLRE